MIHFFDSSGLVKRHLLETGTAWVRGLTKGNAPDPIYIARITAVEVTSAIARRRQGGKISAAQATAVLSRFRKHLAGRYLILEVAPALVNDAMRLAELHALRAYDAVQLAAALELNGRSLGAGLGGITFVSADHILNLAATAEGLAVENPNQHP